MIPKIATLESFGPFAKFDWPAGLASFAPRNVIFGWNATGKTSLSRLFATLQHHHVVPADDHFQNARFRIEAEGSGVITEHEEAGA